MGALQESRWTMRKLTNNQYWDTDWENYKQPPPLRARATVMHFKELRVMDKYLKEATTYLEIGCGSGKWMVYFSKKYGLDVTGLDSSSEALKLAKMNLKHNRTKGTVLEGDFLESGTETEKYDIVFSDGLIEHFTDTAEVINAHLNFVKTGGYCILLIPNLEGLNYWLIRHFAKHIVPHIKKLPLEELKSLEVNGTLVSSGYAGSFTVTSFNARGRKMNQAVQLVKKFVNALGWLLYPFESSFLSPTTYLIYKK